jgi:hypothetical protein
VSSLVTMSFCTLDTKLHRSYKDLNSINLVEFEVLRAVGTKMAHRPDDGGSKDL